MSLADVLHLLEQLPDTATVPVGWIRQQLQGAGAGVVRAAPDPAAAAKEDRDAWLSAKEVAERLNCSTRYVYAHVASFPFVKKLPGGSIRFSEKGLRRWMERKA